MRRATANALISLTSTLVCLVALELILRAYPLLLGDVYANGVLSKYTNREGGIFYYDPALAMNFMIPNLTTRMYYNRYVWTHETDGLGFRNREPITPADVLLIGDSLIYGHGVEYDHTVGHLLHQITGLRVANLGRQGDCAYQEAYLLTAFLPEIRAPYVFYHFTENDVSDLSVYLTDDEMRAFVATPVAAIRYPTRTPAAEALRKRSEDRQKQSLFKRFKDGSYVYKMFRFIRQTYVRSEAHAGPADTDEGSLGWRYTRHAIHYMREVSRRGGATLVVVPLTTRQPDQYRILKKTAVEYGLPFLDTSSLKAADASLWLERDGHLSPDGARRLAELEAAFLKSRGLLSSR